VSKLPNRKEEERSEIRVLVIDDHVLLGEMVVTALSRNPDFSPELATTAADAISKIKENGTYDAVLLDYEMPGTNGLSFLRKIITENNSRVAIFSGVAGTAIVQQAINMGASGYIPKTIQFKNLENIIRLVSSGEVYLPIEHMREIALGDPAPFNLKPRELLALNLLAEGKQNKQIGQALGLEETIIKMIVRSICLKLDVKNRTQAVVTAQKNGLV
jgi:DNA-binding NarL/FixJ family response regulator